MCRGPFKMLAGLVLLAAFSQVAVGDFYNTTVPANSSDVPPPKDCRASSPCKEGVVIPMWRPQGNLSSGAIAGRGIVYFLSLAFMFLGVNIIADIFMSSIEVITSKERHVKVKRPNGEVAVVSIRVWNETVSNLTLMALGSSAPEIMLAVIEIIGNKFKAGALGPGTIVGSAAFNLFIIIGLCAFVIPDGEIRRIKHHGVFIVTATWSVFAYMWLFLIVGAISPGVVEVWEGVLTFIFFPITVLMAYIADRKLLFKKFTSKKYTAVEVTEGDLEMGPEHTVIGSNDPDIKEFEKIRNDYMDILRETRKKHPNMDTKDLEKMAEIEAIERGPKSRAFYRIQSTRKLTGGAGTDIVKTPKFRKSMSVPDYKPEDDITQIFFEPGHYTVKENVGSFACTVTRSGGNTNNTVYVDYRTEDGTANAGSDYEYAEGTLTFHPGAIHQQFHIHVIDDDVFEEDEHFYIRLSNIRVGETDKAEKENLVSKVQLANPSLATVMILDDDHAGIFHFYETEVTFPESVSWAEIKVFRSTGSRGTVKVPYKTVPGTARGGGVDYVDAIGELTFTNDQTEAFIRVRLIDDQEYEKKEYFHIELGQPMLVERGTGPDDKESRRLTATEEEIAGQGAPCLGDNVKITCHIRENKEFKNTVDKLLKKTNLNLLNMRMKTSPWKKQFIDALSVTGGDDDDDDDNEEGEEEEKSPSMLDYVMHYLTVFWKFLFAIVPPPAYFGGWPCFLGSLAMIGVLTAVIGDLASSFGCTIGLKDAVTAISFVALGTSLPDTFASKIAAISDETADAAVGNVTGSNAVNVFLGIGIAWTVAAIYHAANGSEFKVEAGSLGYSVTLFCIFACIAITILTIRRRPSIGGELGGPRKYKIITMLCFFTLWLLYVLLSSLEIYCHIPGF